MIHLTLQIDRKKGRWLLLSRVNPESGLLLLQVTLYVIITTKHKGQYSKHNTLYMEFTGRLKITV